jgi:FKBP-type peptidyl-prolyl cis-trans isomerase
MENGPGGDLPARFVMRAGVFLLAINDHSALRMHNDFHLIDSCMSRSREHSHSRKSGALNPTFNIMTFKNTLTLGCAVVALVSPALAQTSKKTEAPAPAEAKLPTLNVSDDARENASHGLGYLKGRELAVELLKSGYVSDDFSIEGFKKGFGEALSEKDSTVDSKQLKVAIDLMKAHLQERERTLAKTNESAATEWLAANAKKEGVKTTKSGLQYEVVKQGEGEVYKAPADGEVDKRRFLITYEGMTLDEKVFERIGGDKMVAVGEQGIPGLVEALKLMPVGSTWKLFLKPELAYGDRRVNAYVGPNQAVIFTVNLGAIKEVEVQQ